MQQLSDEHLREIGRVSVAFNKVEALLTLFVWKLIRTDDAVMSIVTLGDSFAALKEKFKRLVDVRLKDLPEERRFALEWLQHASKANELRIDAVHGSWIAVEGEEAIGLRRTRRGVAAALLSARQIGTNADYVQAVADQGIRLLNRWQDEIPQFFGEWD
jgi:hypothetical protein